MPDSYDARVMKALAMAMLAAFAGIGLGIFFLSWTYHYVLWVHFGLVGALYSVVKRRHWDYRCDFTWKEKRNLMAGFVLFLIFWSQYIKRKNAWD